MNETCSSCYNSWNFVIHWILYGNITKGDGKAAAGIDSFPSFAGQEIEIRGSILEDVFTKASSITQGATKELVSRMAKRMAEGGDFLQEWSHAVNEVYRKMGWNEQEEELIIHCASDFLLFERGMVKEQLFFDAKQLSQLYEKRITKLGNECKLCRVLSFCAAAFLLILLW